MNNSNKDLEQLIKKHKVQRLDHTAKHGIDKHDHC